MMVGAVVAAMAGDDLLFLWSSDGVVVVANHLDERVVRLRTGQAEIKFCVLQRHKRRKTLGEINRRIDRLVCDRMVVGQLMELLYRSIDQRLLAEAEGGAPHAGGALDIRRSVFVIDVDPLAPSDDGRAPPLQFAEFNIAMKNVGGVACGSRIGEHDFKLSLAACGSGGCEGIFVGRDSIEGAPDSGDKAVDVFFRHDGGHEAHALA
jgi:hypothetical protein